MNDQKANTTYTGGKSSMFNPKDALIIIGATCLGTVAGLVCAKYIFGIKTITYVPGK